MSNQKARQPFRYALIASLALHVAVVVWVIKHASIVTTPPQVVTVPIVMTSVSPHSQATAHQPPVPPRQPVPAPVPAQHASPKIEPQIARPGAATIPPPAPNAQLVSETPTPVTPTGKIQPAEPAFSAPEFSATYLHNPAPEYPLRAKRRGQEGTTFLSVRVGINGRALSAHVSRSSGIPELDEAALDAVRGWTFVPAKKGNEPVEGLVEVPVRFHITN
ncbi:MAG: energy transducer TonB [Burkholderiaceae bacterium]